MDNVIYCSEGYSEQNYFQNWSEEIAVNLFPLKDFYVIEEKCENKYCPIYKTKVWADFVAQWPTRLLFNLIIPLQSPTSILYFC